MSTHAEGLGAGVARLDIMTEMGMMAEGMKHNLLNVSGEQRGHAAHLHVFGEIDLATAPILEGWLQAAERNDTTAIVVDLEHVTFIDASGLRAFLRAAQRANQAGRTLELTNAPAIVLRVLQLTGCTHLLAADPLAQSPDQREPAPFAAQAIVARPSIARGPPPGRTTAVPEFSVRPMVSRRAAPDLLEHAPASKPDFRRHHPC